MQSSQMYIHTWCRRNEYSIKSQQHSVIVILYHINLYGVHIATG